MRHETIRHLKDRTTTALFVLPALIIFLFYFVYPIPTAAFYSFFKWDGLGDRVFIGFRNWGELFQDGFFWGAFLNNIKLLVLAVIIQLSIAMLLALFITGGTGRVRGIMRSFFIIPLMLSSVAVGLLWSHIYEFDYGILNTLLRTIGLEGLRRDWLGDPNLAIYSGIVATAWRHLPFFMILFQAAIVGIPVPLYESADVEGASAFQKFRYVTFPLIMPTLVNALILITIGSLKYFDIIFALTQGGPYNSSNLMAIYLYKKAFGQFRMGYGSAIATALFLIVFIVVVTIVRSLRRLQRRVAFE